MYNNSSSSVQSMDGPTKEFLTTAGILQGDTLAPYVFVIVVDSILRQSLETMKEKGIDSKPKRSNHDRDKHLTDLDSADGIAWTATLLEDARDLLISVEDASAKVGLFLNAKKTEYITISEDADHLPIFSKDGSQLN